MAEYITQPAEAAATLYNSELKSNGQLLLVLTGTITPDKGTTVARSDPRVRRADYLKAFTYWMNHSDWRLRRVLFLENSGACLDEFQEVADKSGKEVELISVTPNPPPPQMHYSYSELQMLDWGLAESRLRQATTHMIKTTGRLIFPALPKLLDRLPEDPRLVADGRARLPFRKSERGFISTQLFLARHDFYDTYLRKSYQDLAKAHHYPYFMEHLFFEKLNHLQAEPDVFLRFPINCEPVGFAGHGVKQYDSPSRALITKARAISRVIAPNFWL